MDINKKVLISGISGFVGTNLSAYLTTKGFEVHGLSRKKRSLKDIVNYTYDSIEEGLLSEFDAIIHLAGKAHDVKNNSKADEYFTANYDLTKKLYDGFQQSKANKFIFLSSVKAAADTVEDKLDENHPPQPVGPYGESKHKAEAYILTNPPKENNYSYIFRPCMIHGPGNKGNLNLLYKFVQNGIPYPLGIYHNLRSFLSIDNLNYAIHQFLIRDIPGGVYNLADDEPLSTNQLIALIGLETGKKVKIWRMPEVLVSGLAKLGDLLPLPINSSRLNKLTENYIVLNNKVKHVLNEDFPVSSVEGLKKTIRSFNQK